jgi:hypothetical protein
MTESEPHPETLSPKEFLTVLRYRIRNVSLFPFSGNTHAGLLVPIGRGLFDMLIDTKREPQEQHLTLVHEVTHAHLGLVGTKWQLLSQQRKNAEEKRIEGISQDFYERNSHITQRVFNFIYDNTVLGDDGIRRIRLS